MLGDGLAFNIYSRNNILSCLFHKALYRLKDCGVWTGWAHFNHLFIIDSAKYFFTLYVMCIWQAIYAYMTDNIFTSIDKIGYNTRSIFSVLVKQRPVCDLGNTHLKNILVVYVITLQESPGDPGLQSASFILKKMEEAMVVCIIHIRRLPNIRQGHLRYYAFSCLLQNDPTLHGRETAPNRELVDVFKCLWTYFRLGAQRNPIITSFDRIYQPSR